MPFTFWLTILLATAGVVVGGASPPFGLDEAAAGTVCGGRPIAIRPLTPPPPAKPLLPSFRLRLTPEDGDGHETEEYGDWSKKK